MKINLVGSIFGSTGYAAHARGMFNALAEQAYDVKLDTQLIPGWEMLVNDAELRAIKLPWFDDGVTICIGMPSYWELAKNFPCKKFVGCLVWEGDRVPDYFMKPIFQADLVVVPSLHVRQAVLQTLRDSSFAKSGIHFESLDVPHLFVVPHGVDTLLFQPKDKPVGKPFVFMANKGWSQGVNDRGGLQWVIRAFAEEFRSVEPVQLNMKINMSYASPGWDARLEREKLGLPIDHAPIYMSTDDVVPASLPQMYEQADCFVTGAMAEAFNIPCLEAMACGLPVITTAYGGQLDYVDEATGWLVPGSMFEVQHDLTYEGVSWMRPDIPALRAAMRYAFEHPEETMAKGITARTRSQSYTWRDAASKLLELIQAEMNK